MLMFVLESHSLGLREEAQRGGAKKGHLQVRTPAHQQNLEWANCNQSRPRAHAHTPWKLPLSGTYCAPGSCEAGGCEPSPRGGDEPGAWGASRRAAGGTTNRPTCVSVARTLLSIRAMNWSAVMF